MTGIPQSQSKPVIAAALGLGLVAGMAGAQGGVRLALAAMVGALGGVALYHAAFGFTFAWRRFARDRRGAGLRAQMILIGLCVLVCFPLIAWGEAIGIKASGWVFPVGVASAIGAAMFGLGMQLGGGCGSGTLFTVGGGSVRMGLTLAAFIAGSVLWTGTWQVWDRLPRIGGVSAIRELGVPLALAGSLALFALIWWTTVRMERARHGDLEPLRETGSVLRGPWSLTLGALVLAAVVILTFVTLGRPWGITSAFPLWGVKTLHMLGVPVQAWNGWSDRQVAESVFAHSTSVMNFGVMLGALAAAGLAGRYAPSIRMSGTEAATAIAGGLMMGYGARLAYGCNIGGFLGGVVSGSLHGWWWLVWGWLGSIAGVRVRAWVGMDPS